MLYQPVLYVLPKYSNKITFPEEVDQGFCVLFTEGTGIRWRNTNFIEVILRGNSSVKEFKLES